MGLNLQECNGATGFLKTENRSTCDLQAGLNHFGTALGRSVSGTRPVRAGPTCAVPLLLSTMPSKPKCSQSAATACRGFNPRHKTEAVGVGSGLRPGANTNGKSSRSTV